MKEKSGSSPEATRESVVRPPFSLRTRAQTCKPHTFNSACFQLRMSDLTLLHSRSAIVYLPQEQKDAENVRDYINEKTNGLRMTLLLPLDLKSEANCIKAVEETVANFGRLDVLFNKCVPDA